MKSRKNKHASIPKPFISMTDMLVSLNAGLLVLGILSAVNPDDEKAWRGLQQETARTEAAAADLGRRTQALQRRQQGLIETEDQPKTPPTKENQTPKSNVTQTLANE